MIMKAILIISVILLAGCDHISSKVYQIKTVDGVILNLYCPTVDRGRSKLTYTIDEQCRLVHE